MLLAKIDRSILFSTLVILSFLSILWMPKGIWVFLGIIAVIFVFHSTHRVRNRLEFHFLVIFLISATCTILLALAHFELVSVNLNQYGKTLGKAFFPAVFILIVDAISYLFREFKIDPVSFAKVCIWALLISTLLRIGFVYEVSKPNLIGEVFLGNGRVTFLSGHINPNHADDLYLIHIAILVVCNCVLIAKNQHDWKLYTASFLLAVYFALSFYITGSRGGHLGLLVGLIVFIGLGVFRIQNTRLRWGGIFLGIAIGILALVPISYDRGLNVLNGVISYSADKEKLTSEINKSAMASVVVKDTLEGRADIDRKQLRNECYPIVARHNEESLPNISLQNSLRLPLWLDGLSIWLEKPYLGHGYYDPINFATSYNFVSKCHMLTFSHIHSFYLDLLIRGGTVILAMYLAFFLYMHVLIQKFAKDDNSYSLFRIVPVVYLTYLMIENVFDLTFMRNSELLSYSLSFAIILGLYFSIFSTLEDG